MSPLINSCDRFLCNNSVWPLGVSGGQRIAAVSRYAVAVDTSARLINIYDTAEHLAWSVRSLDANYRRLAYTYAILPLQTENTSVHIRQQLFRH